MMVLTYPPFLTPGLLLGMSTLVFRHALAS